MSVTFSPVVNHHTLKEEDQDWTATFVRHCKWDEQPEQFKELEQKFGELDEFLYNEGIKPLGVWQRWIAKLGMILFEDYAFKKVYTDAIAYKVVIILNGEPKIHNRQEMQLSNENAGTLCQLLGIQKSGHMKPIALLKRIEAARGKSLADFTRETVDDDGKDPNAPMGLNDKARMISFGLDENQIRRYLMRLEALCDHCIQHECEISWG